MKWIEEKGIQPMLIAGESLWQAAKQSRHLEVLKENMSSKPRVGRYLLCLLVRKMKVATSGDMPPTNGRFWSS